MSAVLQSIVTLLTSGIVTFATGIGSGLTEMVEAIFLNSTGDDLSTFGGVVIIFGGLGLAISLSRWVTNWITSFGN